MYFFLLQKPSLKSVGRTDRPSSLLHAETESQVTGSRHVFKHDIERIQFGNSTDDVLKPVCLRWSTDYSVVNEGLGVDRPRGRKYNKTKRWFQ